MKFSVLHEADKRAVDMVLDHLSVAPSTNTMAFAQTNVFPSSPMALAEPARLNAVVSLLAFLEHFEVAEPPADLVARTLARVQQYPLRTNNPAASLPRLNA